MSWSSAPAVPECSQCGADVSPSARFCGECGALLERPPASPPTQTEGVQQPSTTPSDAAARGQTAGARIDHAAPGAADFAAALSQQLRTPAVLAALISAAVTVVAVVAAGFLTAVATTASSVIGGFDISLFREAMLQSAALVRAPFHFGAGEVDFDVAFKTMPAVGLLIPLGAMAVTTRIQARRDAPAAPGPRLAIAVGAAVPFALLMIIPASLAKATQDEVELSASVGTVFGLSLLWGAVGALVGAWPLVRQIAENTPAVHRWSAAKDAVAAAIRGLLIAFALSAVVMTVCVVIQTVRDAGDSVADRATVGAAVENGLFAAEHAVHGLALGGFASFETSELAAQSFGTSDTDVTPGLLVPLPVNGAEKLLEPDSDGDRSFRVFDYSDLITEWKFLPWVIALMAIVVVLALYAGFSAARAAGARSVRSGALAGVVVAPVWAVAMVVATAVTKGTDFFTVFGHPRGDSVFGWTLLVALVAGVLGGCLAIVRGVEPGSGEVTAA